MRYSWFLSFSGLLFACAPEVKIEGSGGNASSSNGGASTGEAAGTSQGGEGSGGEPAGVGGGNLGGTGGSGVGGTGGSGVGGTGGSGVGGTGGAAPTCGDGQLDPGETCDPPSSCPTTCDDADACTSDLLTGSSGQCNVACGHSAVTSCGSDGCCPIDCLSLNDSDCGGTIYGPVHTFAGYSSSFFITQLGCSPTGGGPAGDALWFCEHFYAPTCTALPGAQPDSASGVLMFSGSNCYTQIGVDVPGTDCIGGPCKIESLNGGLSGITNIVCQCP